MVGYTARYSVRPLLVAGHGIRLAGAQEELMRVLECGIPVVTTFNGFDLIPSDHPCFVGRIGTLGTEGGINALRNCDLLICVGTRNNIRQVSYHPETFAPQASKLIIDIDNSELCKHYLNHSLVLNMGAKEFLRGANFAPELNPGWLYLLKEYSKDHPIELTPPYKFIHDLTSQLSEGAVVVCGNGSACNCMFQAGIVKKNQRIFWNSGCATMGYDLPAAIGACIANGNREVICITGDGSIQMNIQELQTIKHYCLPIKIFVLNNGGYRSIELTQEKYFNADYIGCNSGSGVSFPGLERIAWAYGFPYFNNSYEALKMSGACICEIMIGKDYEFKPKWTRGY